MRLFFTDSDLRVQNVCWRYLELSSHLPCKARKGFGCIRDVFRSIWSQANWLFEWQKLRKIPIFRIFWDAVKIFEKHVMSLFSPDSDLSVPNGCWRYLEVSSYLPDKVWRGFGCTLDVFRSIWSQENRLFECQKLRKTQFFEFEWIFLGAICRDLYSLKYASDHGVLDRSPQTER